MDGLDLQQLAPIAEKIGAWGTGAIVALILIFKLLKQWLEYRATRAEADKSLNSESEVEALLEIVAEDEEEDEKLITRVDTITEELAQIRAELDALKRSLGE